MGLFVTTFLVIFALITLTSSLGFKFLETQKKRKVTSMLETQTGPAIVSEAKVLLEPGEKSGFAATISHFDLSRKLTAMIQQAGLNWTVPGLLAQMLIVGFVGGILGYTFNFLMFRTFSALATGGVLFFMPYLYLLQQRRKRLKAFEQQFPEGLDFLSRAMRSGHAFSIALEMLAEESPNPLGVEFRKVFNEHNLGLPIETALGNLVERVPLLDVRFFVSAILLQRETGGNLSEILTKLARIIRERFQLKGQVQAASAHGRITGTILTLMPIALMLGLMVVAPSYLQSMAEDPDGKYLIIGCLVGLVLGHFTIRKIIDIKV